MIIDSLSYDILATMFRLNQPEQHHRQEYYRFKDAVGYRYSDLRSKIIHEED